jgi:hypothetical protein
MDDMKLYELKDNESANESILPLFMAVNIYAPSVICSKSLFHKATNSRIIPVFVNIYSENKIIKIPFRNENHYKDVSI